ncbi:MAG: MBL fold metallo-hydrolase [Bacteroidales bacterium]|jgi:phosphoribosyl 1,2-cyclic phosphate phosphodiesterase|nr:MBL fold metallo-hydrolase [Bacteroidales bacterium]
MKNTITFLGTGTSSGVPMIGCRCSVCSSTDEKDKRLRASAYIEYEGFKILIDCGPDFRQQALRAGISELDAILLTHQHKDHTGGLDDIRAFNFLQKSAFPIYCEPMVLESLKKEYSYAAFHVKSLDGTSLESLSKDSSYPGSPEYEINLISDKPFTITKNIKDPRTGRSEEKSLNITPIRAMHYKLPVLGFRIGDCCYVTDANYIAKEEFTKMKKLKIFVINTVRRTKHISHYSLPEALDVIAKVGAQQSFITHLSHQMADDEQGIKGTHRDLLHEMPDGVQPAYDGLIVEF